MTREDVLLEGLTWPDVSRKGGSVLVIPLGSTEQHGPHLPLDTDTRVVRALAEGLAKRRADVLIAPALAYGSSGEHSGFPGTLSIGGAALETVLVELVRSARGGHGGVVLLSWHGGNTTAVDRAVSRLRAEGQRVMAWFPQHPAPADAHAGRTETSLMMAITPRSVRSWAAEAGNTTPISSLMDALRADGVLAHSPNGVLGDPAGASPEEGRRLLGELVEELCIQVDAWLDASSGENQPEG